jgi:hypothetical protein
MVTKSPRPQPEHARTTTEDIQDELEWRRERYSYVEREADKRGRIIGVRRLRLSEQTRLTAMTPDLGGLDEIQNPDAPGTTQLVPQRAQYYIVAMVCEINGAHIPFARNRGELDAVMDRLDMIGMDAAGAAVSRLLRMDAEEGSPLDKAKNLSGIPGSEPHGS